MGLSNFAPICWARHGNHTSCPVALCFAFVTIVIFASRLLVPASSFLFSCGNAIVTAIFFAFTENDLFIGWLLAASGNDIACSLWPAFPPASYVHLFGRIFLQTRLHRLFPEISSPSPPRGLELLAFKFYIKYFDFYIFYNL